MGLPRAWFAFRRMGCVQLLSLISSCLADPLLFFHLYPNPPPPDLSPEKSMSDLSVCFSLASVVDGRQLLKHQQHHHVLQDKSKTLSSA